MKYYLRKLLLVLGIVGLCAMMMASCKEDKYSSNPNHMLTFSTDTVSFDTVFTTIGSATAQMRVYNRNKENLKITSIRLKGGNSSPFRVNVDGFSDVAFHNVCIERKDSLYVFVEVTVDATDDNLPFSVEDELQFMTNSNLQTVHLVAYGQNAVFLTNWTTTQDTTLTAERPFVVKGDWHVQKNATLTIEKGCKIYFHREAGLWVDGTLKVNGTIDEPVLFRADRLDYFLKNYKYDDLSGQWDGIYLSGEDAENEVNGAVVRNGDVGISLRNTSLSLKNSIVHNVDSCGIFAKNSSVKIANSLLSNARMGCLKMVGGKVEVEQSTLANYYTNLAATLRREGTAVVLTNEMLSVNENSEVVMEKIPLEKALFTNCVITGPSKAEVTLHTAPQEEGAEVVGFNYMFVSSLLTMKKPQDEAELVHYKDVVWTTEQQIVDAKFPYNFHLKEKSLAIDTTCVDMSVAAKYPLDLSGMSRMDDVPDLGAYEYFPVIEDEK